MLSELSIIMLQILWKLVKFDTNIKCLIEKIQLLTRQNILGLVQHSDTQS